jgi:acetyl-CoA acetyltransferase
VIVPTTRTPIGKAYRGALSGISGPQLAAHALTGPRDQAGITSEKIHDIGLGCAEGNQPATSLAGLKPVLGNRSSLTVTAGYASQLYDGASPGSRQASMNVPRHTATSVHHLFPRGPRSSRPVLASQVGRPMSGGAEGMTISLG